MQKKKKKKPIPATQTNTCYFDIQLDQSSPLRLALGGTSAPLALDYPLLMPAQRVLLVTAMVTMNWKTAYSALQARTVRSRHCPHQLGNAMQGTIALAGHPTQRLMMTWYVAFHFHFHPLTSKSND